MDRESQQINALTSIVEDLKSQEHVSQGDYNTIVALQGEIMAVVDSALPPKLSDDYRDLAWCSRPDDHALFHERVELLRVAQRGDSNDREPSGRWIGMLRVAGPGREWLLESLDALRARADFNKLGLPDLLNHMIEKGRPIQVLYIHGHWLDVNRMEDLSRASDFAHGVNIPSGPGVAP